MFHKKGDGRPTVSSNRISVQVLSCEYCENSKNISFVELLLTATPETWIYEREPVHLHFETIHGNILIKLSHILYPVYRLGVNVKSQNYKDDASPYSCKARILFYVIKLIVKLTT